MHADPSTSPAGDPESILVVDPCSMEEAVLSTPAYAALASRFCGAARALWTEDDVALLLRGDPHFGDVYGLPTYEGPASWMGFRLLHSVRALRRRRFDWIIDLSGRTEVRALTYVLGARTLKSVAGGAESAPAADADASTRVERKMALLERIGCPARRRTPVLLPAQGDERYVEDLLAGTGLKGDRRFVVFAPSPAWNRVLPPEALAAVVDGLVAERPDLTIVYCGSPDVSRYLDAARSAGGYKPSAFFITAGHFAAFAALCELVVGAGRLHSLLAAAVGAKMIGVYGDRVQEDADATDDTAPIAPAALLAVIRENIDAATRTKENAPRRRYYESESFRAGHRDANLFLHTAP
jgi:ADP-heptose:LPS heptosyltransferase